MIIDKCVKIIIRSNNILYYKNLLDQEINIGDLIEINPHLLSKGSHFKINVKCDKCGKEKEMMFKTYVKNTNNFEKDYLCTKCCKLRKNKTMFKLYGKEHALQIKTFKQKYTETLNKNYGVSVPLSNKNIRDKFEKTMLNNYNVKHALQNIEFLEKLKNNDGLFYVETEEFKEKSTKTCNIKYNKNYYIQTTNFRELSKTFFLNKYGVSYQHVRHLSVLFPFICNPMQVEDIFNKSLLAGLKIKKFKNYDIFYQGSYEFDFLEYCEQLGLINSIKRGPTINYDFCDRNHVYFPDFIFKDLVIEIKSSYIYKLHFNKNITKQKYCIDNGYDHIFIIDKNYIEFDKKINEIL